MKSSSQIFCCHGRVALSKAYNYYQLRQLSWPWNNLVQSIKFDTVARKVDIRLPERGNSNSYDAMPVNLIIMMMKWIRLSINNSLSDSSHDYPRTFIITKVGTGHSQSHSRCVQLRGPS